MASSLYASIQAGITQSLKGKDSVRAETLRFLLSGIKYRIIAKYGSAAEESVTDADVLDEITKQVKSHKESIAAFTQAGRVELSSKEEAQLAILAAFLPPEMTDDEIERVVSEVVEKNKGANFGVIMGQCMARLKGKADGKRVSDAVRKVVGSA